MIKIPIPDECYECPFNYDGGTCKWYRKGMMDGVDYDGELGYSKKPAFCKAVSIVVIEQSDTSERGDEIK